jgi:nitrile hydratase beta subunit
MNSVHDMGGMHGMGPIEYDKDEPVFHEPWEGRAWALVRTMGRWGTPRTRNFRYELELIPAADYLRMSYYERFISLMIDRLLRANLVTRSELESGTAESGSPKPAPPPPQAGRVGTAASGVDAHVKPRFKVGQQIRARIINPLGHTRLPRYTRGRLGTIARDHGPFAFQDTDVHGDPLSQIPQHVYTVRFAARELWGAQADPRDGVYVDVWDDHLEHA